MLELILGGARSGKSHLAEQRASALGLAITCIATAEPGDEEMRQRIRHHQQQRPAGWQLVEAPLHLASALKAQARPDRCLIVDCLTLWLSNLLCQGAAFRQAEAGEAVDCPLFRQEMANLLGTLPGLPGHIILVSNETGLGIVPLGAGNRLFVDEQGRLNQAVARIAQRVTLVAAGLPLQLKNDD